MDDKTALLNQLRIDRSSEPAPSRKGWIWAGAALAIAAAAAVAAWWWMRPGAVPVHVVTAQPIAGTGAAAAGSILDASGYVVARRQATVASKITAKMVELDIEEGDHVKAGQIIAKLDDTNIRAALESGPRPARICQGRSRGDRRSISPMRERDYDRQKSLLQGHFVSQAAVDNAQTTHGCAARAARHPAQQRRCRGARTERRRAQSRRHHRARAIHRASSRSRRRSPGRWSRRSPPGGGFTRTGIGTIVDMDSLEIQVDVNENFINRVQPGAAGHRQTQCLPRLADSRRT